MELLASYFPMDDGFSMWLFRTIQLHGGQAIYGVGGGITWDSTWESEYREVHQKAAVLYRKQPRFQLITTGKISQKKIAL